MLQSSPLLQCFRVLHYQELCLIIWTKPCKHHHPSSQAHMTHEYLKSSYQASLLIVREFWYNLGKNKFLIKKFFYQCVCEGVYKPSSKGLNTTPLGEPMATAGSWTHDLIQKWFIWLNLQTLQTILLDEVDKKHIYSLLLVVMIILITHAFLKSCCI